MQLPSTLSSTQPSTQPSTARTVALRVNGQGITHKVPVHLTLAELLRDRLRLTGTKLACNQAACGACTVLLDGQPVMSCHTLAAQAQGAEVQTIEGLAQGDTLHPLQQAFISHDALQCGFCTPGMLMALKAAMDSSTSPSRDELARAISGNLCRCGAYEQILDAALSVLER